MIRHLVHLRFREDVGAQTKSDLMVKLAGLCDHIEGITDFQSRPNVSVETPLVRGFVDMFWFDFQDAGVRDVYLNDPVHQSIGAEIVQQLEGGADGVFVCDIEV